MQCLKFALSLLFLSGSALSKTPAELLIRLSPAECKVAATTLPDGSIPSPAAIAKDAYCVALMMETHAPRGALTIFGSARTREDQEAYQITRSFAHKWTVKHGKDYPVLTGGGRGIMEAGNRGAFEAKGVSLSIGTWFTGGLERPNHYTTQGYMAASFSQRETDLVDYAMAVVVAPGGYGTEWEIFETLSKVQTKKKKAVPVVLLGGRKTWQSFIERVNQMKDLGTISVEDLHLFYVAESADDAVAFLTRALPTQAAQNLPIKRKG